MRGVATDGGERLLGAVTWRLALGQHSFGAYYPLRKHQTLHGRDGMGRTKSSEESRENNNAGHVVRAAIFAAKFVIRCPRSEAAATLGGRDDRPTTSEQAARSTAATAPPKPRKISGFPIPTSVLSRRSTEDCSFLFDGNYSSVVGNPDWQQRQFRILTIGELGFQPKGTS